MGKLKSVQSCSWVMCPRKTHVLPYHKPNTRVGVNIKEIGVWLLLTNTIEFI
jgi:hypothetical protein